MILSGKTIQKLLDDKVISITPKPVIKEASIEIHLSDNFAKSGGGFVSQQKYELKPKEFILGLSREKITLPQNHAGLYDGYTHLARRGVTTHMGSMFIDPGSDNHITLEIYNASDKLVILEDNMRVGHIVIMEVK